MTAAEGRTVHPQYTARLARLEQLGVALGSLQAPAAAQVEIDEDMLRKIRDGLVRLDGGVR